MLTNRLGIPVAISVFDDNTGDLKTVMPQVDKMQDDFDIEEFVLVGDRGMLTQKQIDELRDTSSIDWIGPLRLEAIKKLGSWGEICESANRACLKPCSRQAIGVMKIHGPHDWPHEPKTYW